MVSAISSPLVRICGIEAGTAQPGQDSAAYCPTRREEGKPPSLVIGVTSDSTRDEDLWKKKTIYERLGVEEYLLFDPLRDYLDPPFQGYCLMGGRYQPTPLEGDGSLISRTTGLQLRPEGHRLRLLDPATGEPLLSHQEVRNRLAATEKEIAELRRELAGRRPQSRRS